MSDVDWLYIDLNSYFASVEQELRPELRGKPVGIIPMLAETTSCIAASYEAKAFGVKTGTLVADARKMCPGIEFVTARHREYVDYHHRIIDAVEKCFPITGVMSIDEIACHLTGRDRQLKNAIELAKEVKQAIRGVGSTLSCSVGLGPNQMLAKMASDMQKPDGLTWLLQQDIPTKLFKLKLQDFIGIGSRMEARFHQFGIRTVEQLYTLDVHKMRAVWGGVVGERFYHQIRGKEMGIEHESGKSIGHSHVLPPDMRTPTSAMGIAQKLLFKAAQRLRKNDQWARRMSLGIRYTNRTKWFDQMKFADRQDSHSLNEVLLTMWKKRPPGNPLKISIVLSDLVHSSERTLSFFDNVRRENLSQTIDKLNSKLGRNALYLGGVHDLQTAAPSRIAFTQIPDIDD